MAPVFEEVDFSDLDSVSVTSTRSSIEQAEYNVEKVLAEDWDEDTEVMKYLVKWEGYPLALSTWEPKGNLISTQILPIWEQEKAEIQAGLRQAFDVEAFYELQEQHIQEQDERRQRRKAKRRKLGMSVSRSRSVSVDSARDVDMQDAAEDAPQSTSQQRVKTVMSKHKGVATTVKKSVNRQATTASSSEDSSDGEESGAAESLLEDGTNRQKAVRVGRQQVSSGSSSRPTPARTASATTASTANRITKHASPAKKPASARKSAASSSSIQRRATERSLPSSSARKSAPSSASVVLRNSTGPRRMPVLPTEKPKRKSTGNVSINFNRKPAPKPRRISESDPRHQRYATLSEQNRFHKHASREAAPDVSMLQTFNPATGRFEDPDASKSRVTASGSRTVGGRSTSAMPSVYGRREAPAPTRKTSRSPSPHRENIVHATNNDNTSRFTKVCWDWRNGVCSKPEGFCTFAHHYITCPAWKRGECNLDENVCKFDHREGRDPPVRSLHEHGSTMSNAVPASGNSSRKPSDAQSPILQQPIVMSPRQAMPFHEQAPETSSRKNMIDPPPTPPRMTKPSKKTTLYYKDITCRSWYSGKCHRPNCEFAHHDTGYQIDLKDVTCSYWLSGCCMKTEFKCKFAHKLTEYRAGLPGSKQILFEPFTAAAVVPPNDPNIGPKGITCNYWLNGGCRKEEWECKFVHRLTDYQAGPPGSRQILYRPLAAGKPSSTDAPPPDEVDTEASTFHMQNEHEADGGDPMVLDNDHTQGIVNNPSNAVPASRHSSPHVQSQPAFTHDIDLTVGPEGNENRVAAKLATFTKEDRSLVTELLGSQRHLMISRKVTPTDLKQYCADALQQGARFSTGDVILDKTHVNLFDLSTAVAKSYRNAGICGIVLSSKFTLLIYPSATEEWSFLDRLGDTASLAPLRFKILPLLQVDLPDKTAEAPTATEEAEQNMDTVDNVSLEMAGSHPFYANIERLLKISDTKTEDKVFVMMPETRAAEIKCIVEAFEKRFSQPDYEGRTCKFRTSQKPGSWESFLAYTSCLLLIHPDVKLWEIPKLGNVLHYTGFHVFSVGFDPVLAAENVSDPSFTCERLFPMGDVTFLTDDVFLRHPREALLIVESVIKGNAGKTAGATRHKIAARPGIKAWLLDMVTKQKGDEDPRKLLLLKAIWELCPFEKESEIYPGNPSEDSDLISLAPEQLPTFQALIETDRAKAIDYVVNWFAGWAFMNAGKFRRFTVCHEEPGTAKDVMTKDYQLVRQGGLADPSGWGKEFQYLLVKTPEQWLEWKAKQNRK